MSFIDGFTCSQVFKVNESDRKKFMSYRDDYPAGKLSKMNSDKICYIDNYVIINTSKYKIRWPENKSDEVEIYLGDTIINDEFNPQSLNFIINLLGTVENYLKDRLEDSKE